MRKRLLALIIACVLTLPALFAHAEIIGDTERRALLVGCDDFLTHADTTPSARMNVRRMQEILRTDSRGYEGIYAYETGISSVEFLLSAIAGAFAQADDGDVSLLYICTHGLNDRISFEPGLVLSDGQHEETLSASVLRAALDQVPGQKIVILDACNSGAFIGKGEWDNRMKNWFQGGDYVVLTSAGASENSFSWTAGASNGGSYFADGLSEGLRTRAFDLDGDSTITLKEAYQGILETHGASTAHVYPQESDFPLFVYDPLAESTGERPVGEIELDTNVLKAGEDTLYFSFTVHRTVRVQYQLVYFKDGRWRFESPQVVPDTETGNGILLPGRYQRSITIVSEDDAPTGYVLLQIVAMEGRHATLAGSRVISVQPEYEDPRLRVECFAMFSPAAGEEVAIRVAHAFPCSLTVVVRNKTGEMIRRLGYRVPSRPLGMEVEGSIFYWDGCDASGERVPDGEYYAEVSCKMGGLTYTENSQIITIE
ncbi:MAG: caspase family protein [Clostridia bacterium]|nr:caspase family protein [Clostridia bacterium]